jgi:hypothetical protein
VQAARARGRAEPLAAEQTRAFSSRYYVGDVGTEVSDELVPDRLNLDHLKKQVRIDPPLSNRDLAAMARFLPALGNGGLAMNISSPQPPV